MLALLFFGTTLAAGPFAGVDGSPDEPKVPHDHPEIVAWATGWSDYVVGANCDTEWQTPERALGPATENVMDIVCLGDGGHITMTFDWPIRNGEGWDFAVFENAFIDTFLELAFVEVSTDGVTFVRFDNCSLTLGPVDSIGAVEPSNITGLAGKYRVGFGLGFDLQNLADKPEVTSGEVRLDKIRHVRIVDIVGDGNTFDQRTAAWITEHGPNGSIYDPHPTSGSAGFDLNAVGVRHIAEIGFRLSAAAIAVAEPGGEETFTVVLAGPPDSDVVLNAISANETLATAAPMTLTFTPANWSVAQTVTVTGVDNTSVGDNLPTTITVTVNAALSDPEFATLDDQEVAVTVINDDFTLSLTVNGNGQLDVGVGDHVLGTHNQPFAIAATPEPDHLFAGWTLTGTGAEFATDNPLVIDGLDDDLALTANFAPYHLLNYAAGPNGSLAGPARQTVITGQDGIPVEAIPDEDHHFVAWSDGVLTAARQELSVGGDLAVTANFAINTYVVTFRTDGTRGTTVNDANVVTETVIHGSTTGLVTAAAPPGLDFTGWSGDYASEAATISVTAVTGNMTMVANFARRVAVGSVFQILPEQVFDQAEDFAVRPRILATFTPKPGKATAKVLTKVSPKTSQEFITVEWTKPIRLYDAKTLAVKQRDAVTAEEWLLAEPPVQTPLDMNLAITTKQGDIVNQHLFRAALMPPEITAEIELGEDARGNATWIIAGKWFGTRRPKVWREFTDQRDRVKRQSLKVLRPEDETLRDSRNRPAFMDAETGDSRIVVLVPTKPPKGKLTGFIVLDNGVGLAIIEEK